MKNQILIEGILQQNNKIYQWIYKSWYPSVKAYVINNSGTTDNADDLFQNAMIDLYLNLKQKKFKDERPLKSYFMMICKYKWLNHLRGHQNKNTVGLPPGDLVEESYMEAITFKESLLDLMEHYLTKMSESCKAILNGFYFKKKSLQTIADENNWTLNYAKKNNHGCRKKLRTLIENDKNYKRLVR